LLIDNTFKNFQLGNWRQFESVNINLENQVTILTGQNSSGKTTILNILAKHFGWNINLISTPYISKKQKKRIWSDVLRIREEESEDKENDTIAVGSIEYNNDEICSLSTPVFVSQQYQLKFDNQQGVVGLHIPSHRPFISYEPIKQIPTDPKTVQQHYQEFQQLLFQTYGSANVRNPGVILKQSLVSLALFGYGNEAVNPNLEYERLFVEFQAVLREVLPNSLGFRRFEIRMPEVVLITDTGQFSLDAMSGGINDVIGMAWQIHMYGADKESCTVVIDEPENHLHPRMQRLILPSFAKAFPRYKFIIATHSPFVVSSMAEAKVFGLIYNHNNKIASAEIGEADLSGTPNKILREIFDVPSNLPIWVEDRIKNLIESIEGLSGENKTERLFEELDRLGLSDHISDIDIE